MPFFYFFLALLGHRSPNCSCIPRGPINEKVYEEYDEIFEGRVLTVTEGDTHFRMLVNRYYKGPAKTIVDVGMPDEEGVCRIDLRRGERWLIFARHEDSGLRTNLCEGNKSFEKTYWMYANDSAELNDDLRFLEEKSKGKYPQP